MAFDLDAFRRSVLSDPLVYDIWDQKYRLKNPDGTSDEQSVDDTRRRVVEAVYAKDPDEKAKADAMWAVLNGYLIPAGRVNAGAGSGRNVTLGNCYVLGTVQDHLPGIQRMIAEAAFTMQQGGGVGVDWSPLRPAGALVKRTGSVSSGVIPFMDQKSAMCETIISGGNRRGAMMGTLMCDHPDLWNERQYETYFDHAGVEKLLHPSFISAKRQRGRLTQYNVSVLVTDAFMRAVEADEDWDLGHFVPRADGEYVAVFERPFPYDYREMDNEGNVGPLEIERGSMRPWYVYRRVKARTIWDDIMRSTYKYAEPGVIFIDRVNARNNLNYCEFISATNPCGEEPLPPYGICDLSSENLAFMVKKPFTEEAFFDFDTLQKVAKIGVRFLDNVLDVTNYPLAAQREESMRKRRIGLGVTGFGDALLQLGLRYDSPEARNLVRAIASTLQNASYKASAFLAAERGAFPLCDITQLGVSPNIQQLDADVRAAVQRYGLRNGVINTVAPNGTISIYSGNVSSGIEPVFSFAKVARKVRQPDGTLKEYDSVDYAYRLYEAIYGETPVEKLPDYFVGATDISPEAHVRMLGAWQEHIDASISKTVNCPESMTFDEFKGVYSLAYEVGCKGCTTYRPDPESGRGSVLSVAEEKPKPVPAEPASVVRERPLRVCGSSYKIKWPLTGTNWYVHVTHDDVGAPLELFITTRDVQHQEWVQALSCTVTAILRRGGDVRFLANELKDVSAATGGAFLLISDQQKHPERYPSIVAAIGGVLEAEANRLTSGPGIMQTAFAEALKQVRMEFADDKPKLQGEECPKCGEMTLVRTNGCKTCLSCGYEQCG